MDTRQWATRTRNAQVLSHLSLFAHHVGVDASLGDARDDSLLVVLVLLDDVRLPALHLLVERVDVRAARNEGMRESVAGAWVSGARAVVHLTNASERFDVGIVRVRRERIDEEERRATVVGGDHGADLLVAAERATRDLTRDLEAELLLERGTG